MNSSSTGVLPAIPVAPAVVLFVTALTLPALWRTASLEQLREE